MLGFYTEYQLEVMFAGILYRVSPRVLCVLGFVQSINSSVMCAGLLYRVPARVLCVLDFYAKCHLGCIVVAIYTECDRASYV